MMLELPDTGTFSVLVRCIEVDPTTEECLLKGALALTVGNVVATAVFTSDEHARRYAETNGLPETETASLRNGMEFCEFLLHQKLDGVTHLVFDPHDLQEEHATVAIDDAIDAITQQHPEGE